ncbi:MAG TPA: universal stress protein [Conexibacter sp.]|nr:universal stress protein [Conexibacter sp.]
MSSSASSADRDRVVRLVVGYDGSDAAGAASAFALWLAGKTGAEARLVHVSPDLAHAAHASQVASAEALIAAAERRLDADMEWRRRLDDLASYAAEGAAVECEVVRGSPAGALVDEARSRGADLLLVGSTGVGALRAAFLGSVSSQVVEHAPCPVLVFREGQPASPAHVQAIVVGVDGSPSSQEALAWARTLAPPLGARLVLVSAYASGVALDLPLGGAREDLRDHAVGLLRAARERAGEQVAAVEEAVEGGAREQLAAACERHGPALLAVGSRGLGGFAGLLLGSTSRWLLNHAPCPVLVARSHEHR